MTRHIWRNALAGALGLSLAGQLLLGTGVASASSTVHGLTSAALQKSDVPAAYTIRKAKIYHRYTHKMRAGGSCPATPAAITATSWKEGLASAVMTPGKTGVFQECAYLVADGATAHAAYGTLKGDLSTQATTAGTSTAISGRVGDESSGYNVTGLAAVRALVFRHANAVVLLAFRTRGSLGSVSQSRFLRVARAINARLR